MSGTPTLLYRLEKFGSRFPWLLPAVGFVGGWLGFILVQRGDALARVIAMVVLAGWIWLFIQPWILRWSRHYLPKPTLNLVSNFVSQSLQQEILFFCLPFLIMSTQMYSAGQIIFTSLVFAAALVSTIDPLYEKYIAADRIISLAFHSMCSFVAALVILPIVVKIPLERSFWLALGFVTLWLALSAPNLFGRFRAKRAGVGVLVAIVAIPVCLLVFRQSIPPAGIRVTRSMITNQVNDLEPASRLTRLTTQQLSQGVYAYVAIRAPQGLAQDITFNWKHNGSSEVITSTITGGRQEGYRTYAFKENFTDDTQGRWEVDIRTPQGQLLDRLRFDVDANPDAEEMKAMREEPIVAL